MPGIEEWLRGWHNFFAKYEDTHIEITGGEPFIFPGFIDLISNLSKRCTIRITSNLSIGIDVINNFIEMADANKIKLLASFHPSFAQLNTFFEKISILKGHGFLEAVIFVAYPPQMKQLKHLEEKFKENGVVFSVTPFWGRYKGHNYPEDYCEEERKILASYLGNETKRLEFTLTKISPKGRLCHAGQYFALLSDDGSVFRCGQLKNKTIGNFFDTDFTLLSSPLPCESNVCPCDDHNYLEEG
jgi:MoaA/NifB/PqqE/SkfB family radical SAM enzyme